MFGGQQQIDLEERLALGAIDLALQLILEQGFDEPPAPPPGGTPPGSPPHPPSPPPTPPLPLPPPGPPVRRRRHRGPNIPRQRFSSVGMSPAYILRTFRLDMPTIVSIVAEIQQDLQPAIAIQTAVPPLLKLLAVLHFCATGSYQHSVGMGHGISQPMFSRILKQVLAAMIRVVDRHIFFPQDQAAFLRHKGQFYAIANMPHTIGCIDCTHVAIVPPLEHEVAYRNRKMQHTLNVQMVCDSMLCIQYVCARYPGSCHDATVLRGSALYPFMEGLADQRLWLLGDSGYPLLPWLMTPVRNPQTPGQRRYNAAHIATRNTVERTFGVLKARFRCLQRTGGALMYSPEKCGDIVVICAMFHNIAIRRNVPMPPEEGEDDVDDDDEALVNPPAQGAGHQAGARVRENLIHGFFH